MVIRPFTVDSRQGYESSTVHTSVRIQPKPIAYRLKAYPKKGGTFMERSLLNLQKNSKSQ